MLLCMLSMPLTFVHADVVSHDIKGVAIFKNEEDFLANTHNEPHKYPANMFNKNYVENIKGDLTAYSLLMNNATISDYDKIDITGNIFLNGNPTIMGKKGSLFSGTFVGTIASINENYYHFVGAKINGTDAIFNANFTNNFPMVTLNGGVINGYVQLDLDDWGIGQLRETAIFKLSNGAVWNGYSEAYTILVLDQGTFNLDVSKQDTLKYNRHSTLWQSSPHPYKLIFNVLGNGDIKITGIPDTKRNKISITFNNYMTFDPSTEKPYIGDDYTYIDSYLMGRKQRLLSRLGGIVVPLDDQEEKMLLGKKNISVDVDGKHDVELKFQAIKLKDGQFLKPYNINITGQYRDIAKAYYNYKKTNDQNMPLVNISLSDIHLYIDKKLKNIDYTKLLPINDINLNIGSKFKKISLNQKLNDENLKLKQDIANSKEFKELKPATIYMDGFIPTTLSNNIFTVLNAVNQDISKTINSAYTRNNLINHYDGALVKTQNRRSGQDNLYKNVKTTNILGYNHALKKSQIGVYIEKSTNSINAITTNNHSKNDSFSIGAYYTQHLSNNAYLDFSYEYSNNRVTNNVKDDEQLNNHGQYSLPVNKISLEYGHPLHKGNVRIIPQIQLQMSKIGASSYTLEDNASVKMSNITSKIVRIGVDTEYMHSDKLTLKLGADLIREFDGKYTASFADNGDPEPIVLQANNAGMWYRGRVGIHYKPSNNVDISLNASKSFGNHITNDFGYDVKASIKF